MDPFNLIFNQKQILHDHRQDSFLTPSRYAESTLLHIKPMLFITKLITMPIKTGLTLLCRILPILIKPQICWQNMLPCPSPFELMKNRYITHLLGLKMIWSFYTWFILHPLIQRHSLSFTNSLLCTGSNSDPGRTPLLVFLYLRTICLFFFWFCYF